MAQQFVMGQLKVSVNLGEHPGMELGLCWVCSNVRVPSRGTARLHP